ncbi:MAG: radical SAM protein [Candidatus Nanoarchaeia archaeon]|jgi:radical SAM superfamily enzyme YgiQ (UPF0313 family)
MNLCFVNLNDNGGTVYPLGILSLMTYLKQYSEFPLEMSLADANFDMDLMDKIICSKPDVVGISAMTVEYGQAIEFAKELKKRLNIPIILGGVHISTLPLSLHASFDIGVIGEGEETLLEILKLYAQKKTFLPDDLRAIKGLIFHNNGEKCMTEPRAFLDLDKIPIGDRSLLNQKYFKPRIMHTGKFSVFDSIFTTRGCPYNCRFCSSSSFWKKVRYHSPQHVVNEIKYLYDIHKIKFIAIIDDLFIADRNRIKEIISLLKHEDLLGKITFSCYARVNLVDDDLCRLLKEMNVVLVGFGFESGSDRMLKWLKKDNSLSAEKNRKAAKMCKDYGLMVEGYLLFGSPGETIDDMNQTVDLIDYFIKIKLDNLGLFVLTPFPATEIWEIAKQRGKVNDCKMDWALLSLTRDEPLLLDDSISKEQFMQVFLKARKKLRYFIWKKIMRDLKNGNMLLMIKTAIKNPKRLTNLLFNGPIDSE